MNDFDVLPGRASLSTSFATYKFLISYGLIFCFTKLIGTYTGTLLSMMHFITIDAITVTTLLYTMTLSEPQERLSEQIPSASLLGARTVASSVGYNFIAFICMVSALGLIMNDPDYVQWPAKYGDLAFYWQLGDNWETTTIFLVTLCFLLGAALVFSFGYKFRKPVKHNMPLVINLGFLFILASALLLMDSNIFTDHFHIASRAFNKANTTSPIWADYQADGGLPSPGMSFALRLKLFFLIAGFLVLGIIWQAEVLEGSVGAHLKHKYGHKRHLPKLIT
jgi:cation-transporting ATPase 13A3/4/5